MWEVCSPESPGGVCLNYPFAPRVCTFHFIWLWFLPSPHSCFFVTRSHSLPLITSFPPWQFLSKSLSYVGCVLYQGVWKQRFSIGDKEPFKDITSYKATQLPVEELKSLPTPRSIFKNNSHKNITSSLQWQGSFKFKVHQILLCLKETKILIQDCLQS